MAVGASSRTEKQLSAADEVRELLSKAGQKVVEVCRVSSPGDAGTAGVEVLFLTEGRKPMKAIILTHAGAGDPDLVVSEGWAL